MDIAKIRKKALSKDTGQRPPEKEPVPGPGEEERKEPETEPAAAEEIDAAPGEMLARTAAGDELKAT
jgi:hypothetical protein